MTSHRLRVSLCTPLFLFIAADAFAEEETDYEAPSQFEKAFYDEGKLNLNTSLYIRHRAVKDPRPVNMDWVQPGSEPDR